MSEIVSKIRDILLEKCEQHKEHVGYDYWNDHIKRVVEHAVYLANSDQNKYIEKNMKP